RYIIPAPFDPRLIEWVPMRVAQAAMDSGVARKPIEDMNAYRTELKTRLSPIKARLTTGYDLARSIPQRVDFAEAARATVLLPAITFKNGGYGIPLLVGRTEKVEAGLRALGVEAVEEFEIHNARVSPITAEMADLLYQRLQRRGFLQRDCHRLVNQDRNVFGGLLVALGHADAMITGVTRHFRQSLDKVLLAIDPKPDHVLFGMHIVVGRSQPLFIADTAVHERPDPETLADIAIQSAEMVRSLGHEPRVAFLSYSNFGNPRGTIPGVVREAVALLDERQPGFEYEGEVSADVALNRELKSLYPFSRLTGPANVLIMPGLHTANITAKLLKEINGGVIGPLLIGMSKPVQIVPMTSNTSDLVNMAVLAAAGALR